jgi:hypothetical protein
MQVRAAIPDIHAVIDREVAGQAPTATFASPLARDPNQIGPPADAAADSIAHRAEFINIGSG